MEREAELRRYLLGVLTPEERAQVEEQLFLDAEFFRLLQSAEDDLIDEYVSGELSLEERERFERSPLSGSEYRADLRIAKALRKYVAAEAEPAPLAPSAGPAASAPNPAPPAVPFIPRPRWHAPVPPGLALAAAAVIVVAVIGLWLILRGARQTAPPGTHQARVPEPTAESAGGKTVSDSNRGVETSNGNSGSATNAGGARPPQNQSDPTPEHRRDPADTKQQANRAPAPPPRREPSGRTYVATLLPVGSVRGEGEAGNRIIVPANADYLTLRLPVLTKTSHRTYEATLTTEEGAAIKVWPRLKRIGLKATNSISLPPMPVSLLSPQKYRLELKGHDRQGNSTTLYTYHFQIAPR